MCAGDTIDTILLLSGFSGMLPHAGLVQAGVSGAEVQMCHLSWLFTECTGHSWSCGQGPHLSLSADG